MIRGNSVHRIFSLYHPLCLSIGCNYELKPLNFRNNNRGLAYGRLGNHRKALENFDRAIKLNKNYAKAYYNRGIAYGKLGNRRQAIEDTKTAARLGYKRVQDLLRRKRIDWGNIYIFKFPALNGSTSFSS